MDFASFQANCTFLSPPADPLFLAILKLRVWVGDMDEMTFKLSTLTKLRNMTFYMRFNAALVDAIEMGLLGKMNPISFWALCEAHGLSVRVVQDPVFYDCGQPTVMWRKGKLTRIGYDGAFYDCGKPTFMWRRGTFKPLYSSLSHYTLSDLRSISSQLKIPPGTKGAMYDEIQKKISEALSL